MSEDNIACAQDKSFLRWEISLPLHDTTAFVAQGLIFIEAS
jgi:hypothetical protein